MADMQVAVRLGRETGLDTSVVHSLREVFFYNLLNEIETTSLGVIFTFIHFHIFTFI